MKENVHMIHDHYIYFHFKVFVPHLVSLGPLAEG